MKTRLSILVITKNAEVTIGGALKSVEGLWDELVVIDTGSSDRTINVAKKFMAKVFAHHFRNDFSEVKNFGLSKVTCDWVLALDSDERLTDELRAALPGLIQNKNVDGYWFRRRTYISSMRYLRYGLFYPDYQLRLFRNKKEYRYRGAVHEQLTIPKSKTQKVFYDILHYPQHSKYTAFADFHNLMPYIHIRANELAKFHQGAGLLFLKGMGEFVKLFLSGYFRGKGFLDGWAGFRAHVMFASSIALAYILAGWRKLMKKTSMIFKEHH